MSTFSFRRSNLPLAVLSVIAMVATLLVGLTSDAEAATYTVTRGDDPVPTGCAAGDCSLREAIGAANAAAGIDTIVLPAGEYRLDRAGSDAGDADDFRQGDLDVIRPVEIVGAGAGQTIIVANNVQTEFNDRIFHLTGGGPFTFRDLTLSGGQGDNNHPAPDNSGMGGAVLLAGDGASFTATNVVFSRNLAEDDGGAIAATGDDQSITLTGGELHRNWTETGGNGGGIALVGDDATLSISGTRVRGNVANASGGGLAILGENADVDITDDSFWGSEVSAFPGVPPELPDIAAESSYWGVFEQAATADRPIEDGEFVNLPHPDANKADGDGGGAIYIDPAATGTSLSFEEGRLDGNRTDGGGGAIKVGLSGTPASDVTVEISSSTLSGNKNDDEGGAIAVWSDPTTPVELTLDDVFATQNNADLNGGVVFNHQGVVTIRNNSTFQNNKADWAGSLNIDGSTFRGFGGAVASFFGDVSITDSTFHANKADGSGGAVFDYRGSLGVDRSSFTWNKSDGGFRRTPFANEGESGGGAVASYAGDVLLERSTFARNKTDQGGGGILLASHNDADALTDDFGSLDVRNSTISSNWAGEDNTFGDPDQGAGAAIYNDSGTTSLSNSTVYGNRSVEDTGADLLPFESLFNDNTAQLATTTIAESALGDSLGVICRTATTGTFVSGGDNVADDTSCFPDNDVDNDEVVTDIRLLQLADYGGPTLTHDPRTDSPVVNHVRGTSCPPPSTDQRGVSRPQGSACDAGAVEHMTPTDLNVAKSDAPDPVVVGDDVTYTITVTNQGSVTAVDVTVTDTFPTSRATFTSASAGCSHSNGVVTCDLGNIAAGASTSRTITLTTTRTGTLLNTATANAEFQRDPDPSDDQAVQTTSVLAPAGPGGPGEPAPGDEIVRLEGETRIQTATAISQAMFGRLGAGSVVLARADIFPDGLAGTPLAIERNAPMLLTPTNELHPDTEAELTRVLDQGKTVYLLGGEEALSSAVEARIAALGFTVVRLEGPTRVETAVAIANELGNPDTVLVVTGFNFPDALAAGPAAAAIDGAILLTETDRRSPQTESYIDLHDPTVIAVGGPVVNPYTREDGAADEQVFGADRDRTAIAVAERFFDEPTVVGVARRDDFPDALAGGAHIGRLGGPMVLTATDTLTPVTEAYLCANNGTLLTAYVYGGPAAIDTPVSQQIFASLRGLDC